jgi:hypothetical protein
MNMLNKVTASLVLAGAMFSGAASAETVVHPGNDGGADFYPSHRAEEESKALQRDNLPPRLNELSVDGQYRYAGGDMGWVPAQHEYAYVNGQWRHVDKLSHNAPRPSLVMTPEERRGTTICTQIVSAVGKRLARMHRCWEFSCSGRSPAV